MVIGEEEYDEYGEGGPDEEGELRPPLLPPLSRFDSGVFFLFFSSLRRMESNSSSVSLSIMN
jgi:hypothetical protein